MNGIENSLISHYYLNFKAKLLKNLSIAYSTIDSRDTLSLGGSKSVLYFVLTVSDFMLHNFCPFLSFSPLIVSIH